ncbi:MAG TPA: gamma carbonic anhydrase family protein [Bryobacteraceae bacterium]|nr:gamma carbonic anhydrase family protein [Bryobacteraceae bacterium]HOQ45727.1 gamma carbonic anhydrase family protein [Bryobacteraceae bacterium]HPQ15950.1 gamma carbonic anhydrase family protein [Bryobacteraceae bacterium]HPU71546.1 gamma carbonic anhydrase family protein [Bryobacteraceae bacterium]
MIRAYRGILPRIAVSAYVDPSAQVIGDVTVGERSSIWPNVTVRGDVHYIRIGDDTSIQDNSVLHVEHDLWPLIIGNRVTVGHSAVLHGCVIEDECLIGIGAIVLNGARVGTGSIIAAGAVVPEGMQVPPRSMVMGIPGKVRREVTDAELERIREGSANYVRYRQVYKDEVI